MVAEVTDIKGIGPAKAETLAENGYESVEDVSNADPDELAEVDGVGDDRALEFIIGAEDVLEAEAEVEEEYPEDEGDAFDLTPAELSDESEEAEADDESDSVDEDDESPSEEEESTDDESEASEEEEYPDGYPVSIKFENQRQFDVFHASIMRHHERHYTGNQPVSDAMQKILTGIDSFEEVNYNLTEGELNAMHAAVSQQRTKYQGDNLINHMDELNAVLDTINEDRREYLF